MCVPAALIEAEPPHHPTTEGVTNASAAHCPQHWVEPRFTQAAKVRVAVTAIFFLLAACSNTAVLGSLLRKRKKCHVRPLILSLALADLLVTVAVMPLDAAWNVTVQWYGGDLSCKLLNFLKLFAMYVAALVLVVISLDRHAAVLQPFARARRRNGLLLRAAWLGSVLLASPQLFLFHLHTVPGGNFTQCVTHGSFRAHWEETVYNMFTFTTLYITPLSIMIVCYVRIIWEISKQLKINKSLVRSQNDHISKARMKTLKMTIVIVATFIICWTPYYLLGLWYWFQPAMIQRMPEYINHSFFLFGLLHTCTDPIIYGLYTPSFREDVQSCLRGIEAAITRHERHKPVLVSEKTTKDGAVNGQVASGGSNGTTVNTVC
ncbi:gonadotropin-releasing hormone II receptor-like [Tympanuchus pallidicinctus]|uniref:gonadotropin-releasing hormone II receptor-like n=1 Tax=Tympanuchus pallidicinctus TaxID=109042 RepID=UPI00228710ED|nr:gonadotropin-releasing hormone II receptor-like [Tympanuchus pallidicinctus]XP_052527671.1 gonadotropin-releasing hormone II receptor-like [Tympanuchus pallidicinctus]XP_052527672.1 gonadotropin-releasing hormone II receptor-like [Tympanuchus pallidicinctus]XP_052527673.1 gonadotropin-releasing hormone II receptor-like [Tympanuchus pallidicinctus]XP_052527675.1 gonadotropin-releasing hormone II receptor-like [Tympanuchus pallidicinctus]XP_052527676.1 gonadotropin-releasing hormone II recept